MLWSVMRASIVGAVLIFSASCSQAGVLVGWGYQGDEVTSIPSNDDFIDFANDYYGTSVGLRADGSIVGWAGNSYVLDALPSGTGYKDVALIYYGNDFYGTGIAISASGAIVGFGESPNDNELSDIPAGSNFTQVVGGYYAGFALDATGKIYGWGMEDSGQLRDIPTGAGYTKVATLFTSAFALNADGSISAWGWNYYNQVSNAPTGTGYKDVAAGFYNGVAVREDGSLVVWGRDQYGLLTNIPTGNDFVKVAMGASAAYALRSNGTIVGWGRDSYDEVSGVPRGRYTAVFGGDDVGFAIGSSEPVPEPASGAIAILLMGGTALRRWRKKRSEVAGV